jgi:hypothetical protein
MNTTGSKQVPTRLTPLAIIALFISLTETIATVAVTQTGGAIQIALTIFIIVFPILDASCFFAILWSRPYAFYPPTEYGQQVNVRQYVAALRGTTRRWKQHERDQRRDEHED